MGRGDGALGCNHGKHGPHGKSLLRSSRRTSTQAEVEKETTDHTDHTESPPPPLFPAKAGIQAEGDTRQGSDRLRAVRVGWTTKNTKDTKEGVSVVRGITGG
jgi:hypothetical protein